MDHKIVSLLGLARRAGKAVLGFDQIEKRPRAFRVLVAASDVSGRTKKNIEALSVPTVWISYTKKELGAKMGAAEVAVTGVTDGHFADQIILYAKRRSL